MGQHRLDYEQLCADALRGVVRRALALAADKGLPGGHHFLITFKTDHPGVVIPGYLRERYPDTISVMLQYEFWNLEVEEDHFAVSLSFSDVRERLSVPHNPGFGTGVPLNPVSDADMLRSLIESRRESQSEVAKATRIAESTISEVLSGKRKLNRTQIGKLARYFHVSPGVFEFGG